MNILDISFVRSTKSSVLENIYYRINNKVSTFIVTANPEIVMYAHKNSSYKNIIKSADIITPDGIGIVKASKHLSTPISERITGYDLFLDLLNWSNLNSKKIFLIGGKPSVLKKVTTKIKKLYPSINLVGSVDGYQNSYEKTKLNIKSIQPDLIFVATGFPKQEKFIYQNKNISNSLWMGIGGSFDVFSDSVNRAPIFYQKHNVEWLYRLIKDPKRIKRQLIIPKFMWLTRKNNKQ